MKAILVSLLVSFSLIVEAQPNGGGDPGHGEPTPITGIEYLLGLGGLLGVKKIMKSFSKKA